MRRLTELALLLVGGSLAMGCSPSGDGSAHDFADRSDHADSDHADSDHADSDHADNGARVQPGQPQSFPTNWTGARTLTIAPGVHVLGELSPSAVYVIETSEGIILVDSGVEEPCYQLLDSLGALQIDPRKIRYVLLTHAHYDHVFGASRLRELTGAIICAGSGDCEVLRNVDLDAMFSIFPRVPYSGQPIVVDRELHDGDKVVLGDVEVEVIGAPGHTPGSVCYILKKGGKRILFSGDAIASTNYGPATYSSDLSPKYRGDARSYLATINRFLNMDPPDLILPGHPRQHNQPVSIRMDPERWRMLLEPAGRELRLTLERHGTDGADFLDGSPKEILPGAYYLGEISNIAVYCFTNEQDFVLFNAPGGASYIEFVKSRLKQLNVPFRKPTAVILTSSNPALGTGLRSLPADTPVNVAGRTHDSIYERGVETVIPDSKLQELVSFSPQVVSLGSHENADRAFLFQWQDKRVAITGPLLSRVKLGWTNRITDQKVFSALQPQLGRLVETLSAPDSDPRSYVRALQRLDHQIVDIWLPATPAWGQNANLYDDQWNLLLSTNRSVASPAIRTR